MQQFGMKTAFALCLLGTVQMAQADTAKAAPDAAPQNMTYFHVFTGPDHKSHLEELAWKPEIIPGFGLPAAIINYFAAKATKISIISVAPNLLTPPHNAAKTREIDIVLSGSSTGMFSDGTSHDFHPGDIVLIEDRTGPGRQVKIGPNGYSAVSIDIAD